MGTPEPSKQPKLTVGSSAGLDVLQPLVEAAAREYYAKWPPQDTAQRLAFQDAVIAAVQEAWRRGASNCELIESALDNYDNACNPSRHETEKHRPEDP